MLLARKLYSFEEPVDFGGAPILAGVPANEVSELLESIRAIPKWLRLVGRVFT
jgi:hypothetical protein